VLLDEEDVSAAIRTAEVAQAASRVAVVAGVRHVLVAEQRRAGSRGGVVMEGRDVGTVIFPDCGSEDIPRSFRRIARRTPLARTSTERATNSPWSK